MGRGVIRERSGRPFGERAYVRACVCVCVCESVCVSVSLSVSLSARPSLFPSLLVSVCGEAAEGLTTNHICDEIGRVEKADVLLLLLVIHGDRVVSLCSQLLKRVAR